MPTGPSLALPTQTLPDSPVPKKGLGMPKSQSRPTRGAPLYDSEHSCSPPPSIHIRSSTDDNHDAPLTVPEVDDEYTLSAYGDISLSDVVPPLPVPTVAHPSPSLLLEKRPRLRLKVQRPPMPKRRLSYAFVLDPPPSEGVELEERWPGSPRPFANSRPWLLHQPLVSPLSAELSRTPEKEPGEDDDSAVETSVDEIVPRLRSVRLLPPGLPTSQARQQARDSQEVDDTKVSPSSPTCTQPKSTPWRTKLPPRPPLPKWDVDV